MEAGGRTSAGTVGTTRHHPSVNRKALRRVIAAATLLMLNLGALGCACDLEITTGSLPDGVVGGFYSFNLDSDCGGDTWFLASGGLPPGIALQANGDLEGVPTLAGVFGFTVGVVDFGSGDEAYKGFTLTVQRGPPTP